MFQSISAIVVLIVDRDISGFNYSRLFDEFRRITTISHYNLEFEKALLYCKDYFKYLLKDTDKDFKKILKDRQDKKANCILITEKGKYSIREY